jgi:hypothetical protein
MPPPTSKENWLVQFETELLLRLRPGIGRKFARTLAVNAWARHKRMKPEDAAKQWAKQEAG